MGRTFEVGVRGVTAAAGAAYATLQTPTGRLRLRELGFFASTAVAASIGLGRAANSFVTTTSAVGQTRDPSDTVAALGIMGTAWSTAPTVPGVFTRRIVLPAVIGAGVIWTWPADPLIVPVHGAAISLVLWNFGAGAGPAPDIYAIWEE